TSTRSPPTIRLSRVLFLLSGVFLCTLYQLTISTRLYEPLAMPQIIQRNTTYDVHNATTTSVSTTSTTTESPLFPTTNRTLVHCIYVAPELPETPTPAPPTTTVPPAFPGEAPHMKGDYPEDIFSIEDRRRGWVTLHIIGMMYMFVSLAIVCDEFFVPALGVITNKLAISDDVAGATFMAAGGSAPELFTSLIGVFIAHSNVGIGTIVGSAVFNILFVIGMCALFSREILHLTWWPLFRDVSFYILGLIFLIIFFLDNVIMWWESMMLVACYTVYVIFMKFNVQIERAFKTQLHKHKSIVKVIAVEEPDKVRSPIKEFIKDNAPPAPEDKNLTSYHDLSCLFPQLKPSLQRGGSSASLHNSTMRNTIFQLMIHTLDPIGNGEYYLIAVNTLISKLFGIPFTDGGEKTEQSKESEPTPAAEEEKKEQPEDKKVLSNHEDVPAKDDGSGESDDSESDEEDSDDESDESSEDEDDDEDKDEEEDEKDDEPLSLEWPDTRRKQATYLFLLPIVFPLWLTVPDVRNPKSRKFFVVTFLGSILWIAIFSYLMVWWAHQVGETIGISEEIMGLTMLAAGTSIPDLITSVIVARKGLGDMAVSSSVGSNIFDITVGLPVPWLLYSAIHSFGPVAVSSNGLFCAIVLLFLMLLFVIISIASCNWKMNKVLGFTMFLLYFIFLVLSVMLEDRIIICPVSI
uniref:Sodium/potassium/calcium exchanger 1 n=1 Tax=Pundamilia nyererei TaxID=303518 RepID=A0A3B4G7J4_9CICH